MEQTEKQEKSEREHLKQIELACKLKFCVFNNNRLIKQEQPAVQSPTNSNVGITKKSLNSKPRMQTTNLQLVTQQP
eukprot:m.58187 g.58187  ORF g.58187 m.58187 type:complete len:76 (-) comp22512_c1_seq1:185-412(-)